VPLGFVKWNIYLAIMMRLVETGAGFEIWEFAEPDV
jgi:hypothetical protein